MVGRAGILFSAGADKRSVLNTCNVVNGGAVQVAVRELFLIQLNHFPRGTSFSTQSFDLWLGAVNPDYFVRIDKCFHFFNPV